MESLVKGSGPAVYYFASDGNRYTFPNQNIFDSWNFSFDDVQGISDTDLAKIPLKGAITYRPGTRLVKLMTDPKVYAVEFGGIFRWIKTEEIANTLYGDNWATRVDDLSDAFFTHYSVGDTLESPHHPDGTVIQYEESGPKYVVWHGTQRKLSDASFQDNGFSEEDVLFISDGSVSYPPGKSISTAEASFTEPAELNGIQRQEDDFKFFSSKHTTPFLIQDARDVKAFSFIIQNTESITLQEVRLRFRALTDKDSDGDTGGLINGERNRTNLQNIRIEDPLGNLLLNGVGLSTSDKDDATQSLTLEGAVELSPGIHPLFVVFDVYANAPTESRYTVQFLSANTVIDGEQIGEGFTDVTSNELEITTGSLLVELGSPSEVQILTPGQQTVDVVTFDFIATGLDPIVIKELVITGVYRRRGRK